MFRALFAILTAVSAVASPSFAAGAGDAGTPSAAVATPAAPPVKVEPPAAPGVTKEEAIIAPGQEELIGRMLGVGAKTLPAGCVFDKADIDKSFVKASYNCDGKPAALQLKHPDGAPQGALKTASFAILPDEKAKPSAALLDSVRGLVAANEAAWRWGHVNPAVTDFQLFIPTLPTDDELAASGGDALSTAQQTEVGEALKLITAKQPAKAMEQLTALAQKNPHHGVLQALSAAIQAAAPDKVATAALTKAADEAPTDPAKQFVAGTALSLLAYKSGAKPELRQSFNEGVLKYLARARPAYDFSPNLFIYMGLAEFRVGHQRQAEELLNRALSVGPTLPDAQYARAEIFQATKPGDAKDALARCQALLKARHPSKNAVRMTYAAIDMLAFLNGTAREAHLEVDDLDSPAVTAPRSRLARGLVLLALLAAGTAGLVFRLRRTSKEEPPKAV